MLEPSCVVAMCDNTVSLCHATSLEMLGSGPIATGAALLCLGRGASEGKICVAKKKSLHFFRISEEGAWEEEKEMAVPDTPMALEWHGSQVAVGYKREYCLLSLDSGESIDVFPLDAKTAMPMLCAIPSSDELLLRLDKMGIFLKWDITASR